MGEYFDRHSAAVEQVDRVHFDFTSVGDWPLPLDSSIRGEFWSGGGVKRTDFTSNRLTESARVTNGVMTFIAKSENGSNANISAWGPMNGLSVMPRHELLLELDSSLQGIGNATLRQVVTAPNANAKISRVGNLVTFKLFNDSVHFVIDLSKNGLVCERSSSIGQYGTPLLSDTIPRRVERVTSFRELVPGVYFPEVSEWDEYLPRGIHKHRTFRTKNIALLKLNATIPKLNLSGLRVVDRVAGKEYTLAPDGTKLNEKDFVPIGVGPSSPAVDETAPSTEPPRRLSWLLPAGVALIVTALILWGYGRHRSRRELTTH